MSRSARICSAATSRLAFFTSIDFDLIPKVLTVTGGTRYYDYEETMQRLAVLHEHRMRGHPERHLRGHEAHSCDHDARPTPGSRAAAT